MLGVRLHLPLSPAVPRPEGMDEVLARAAEAAAEVGGAYASAPCSFTAVPALAAGSEAGDQDATWILVAHARSPEPDHEAHLRERARTAIQRFTLALQCDDVEAVWSADGDAARAAFDGAGLDGARWAPMGLVRCSHDG